MPLSPSEKDLYEKILNFVSLETKTRKKLSCQTDIARDLGVDGDDAVEFIENFKKEFDVDLSNFKFQSYFGKEGFSLLRMIQSLVGMGEIRNPLTISVLLEAAINRRWPEIADR